MLLGLVGLVVAGVAVGYGQSAPVVVSAAALVVVAACKERTVAVVVALGVLTVGFSGVEVGPVTAPDVFFIPAAAVLGLRYVVSRRPHIPIWLIGSASIILAGGLLPHALFPNLPSRSFIILLQFCISVIYVPLVLSLGVRNQDQLRRLGALYVASASINGLFGVLEFFNVTDIASQITGFQGLAQNGGRPAGLTAHPNQLGLLCVLAFPLALSLYGRNRLWGVPVLLLFSGVMVSGSRTAFFGLLFAATVTLWIQGRLSTSRIIRGALALGVVGITANAVGVDVALTRVLGEDSTVAEATEARTDTVRTAIDDIEAYPLTGVGFGKNAHSLYLQLLQGAGVLALAGFLWFASRTLRIAFKYRHNAVASAAGAAMVAWLVTGLIHPGLYDRYLYVPAGIILGAHVLADRKANSAVASREYRPNTTSLARRPAGQHGAMVGGGGPQPAAS